MVKMCRENWRGLGRLENLLMMQVRICKCTRYRRLCLWNFPMRVTFAAYDICHQWSMLLTALV